MNFYEHHLGDWAKDVRGLSLTEEGAYRRLLDAYYSTEQPLPGSLDECCDLANTRSRSDRDAVEKVLHKFFRLDDDDGCFHQKRADAEIARFQELEPMREQEREARLANQNERQRRARQRRAELFAQLRAHDIVPSFKTSTTELSRMLSRVTNRPAAVTRHAGVTRDVTANQSGTRDVTDNHTQSPYPIPKEETALRALSSAPARPPSPGEACKAMREAGLADVNPSNPTLATMLEQGMTLSELADAALAAVKRGKGFAWALERAIGQRRDAGRVALAAPPPPKSARFALPADHKRVLPDDLPDLSLENEHEHDAAARGA